MMRRIVDTAIQAGAAVALAPAVLGVWPLPPSVIAVFGPVVGYLWSVTMFIAFAVDLVGIWLRFRAPAAAWTLEILCLCYLGIVITLYSFALIHVNGPPAWVAVWFSVGIGAYQLARFAELIYAHQVAKRMKGRQ